MNYLVKYKIDGYDDIAVRTFNTIANAIRFVKYNDQIKEYSVYRLNLVFVDIKKDLVYY